VSGAVAAPFEISFDELAAQARQNAGPVTLECARTPLRAAWSIMPSGSGVSLAIYSPKRSPPWEPTSVKLTGADGFSRSISAGESIASGYAHRSQLNGEKLPASHGFPLRAVIPDGR